MPHTNRRMPRKTADLQAICRRQRRSQGLEPHLVQLAEHRGAAYGSPHRMVGCWSIGVATVCQGPSDWQCLVAALPLGNEFPMPSHSAVIAIPSKLDHGIGSISSGPLSRTLPIRLRSTGQYCIRSAGKDRNNERRSSGPFIQAAQSSLANITACGHEFRRIARSALS